MLTRHLCAAALLAASLGGSAAAITPQLAHAAEPQQTHCDPAMGAGVLLCDYQEPATRYTLVVSGFFQCKLDETYCPWPQPNNYVTAIGVATEKGYQFIKSIETKEALQSGHPGMK